MKSCKKCFSPAMIDQDYCSRHMHENVKEFLNNSIEQACNIARMEGVLIGLKICKEMWAQGQMSHENIYENEVYYKEELEKLKNE